MHLTAPPLGREWATGDDLPPARSLRAIEPTVPNAGSHDRLLFIDNLRTMLTMLVVLHHLAVTYTWSVGWYYHEPLGEGAAFHVLSVFIRLTQAFFMGAFFLIAAYFIPGSYERRGALSFIDERILRLVIPLLIYRFGIAPAISVSVGWFAYDRRPSVAAYWDSERSGPLWFLELLLVLTAGWLLWQRVWPARMVAVPPSSAPPTRRGVVTFALLLGLATWLFRIWLPVYSYIGWVDFPTPAFLPQYVALFVVGLVASRRNWFTTIPSWTGKAGLVAIVGVSCTLLPLSMVGPATAWTGNGTPQALAFSLWEAVFCVGTCLALLTFFRSRCDWQGPRLRWLSRENYAVYIIHAPVIVFIALALMPLDLPTLAKFVLSVAVGIPLCYLVAWSLRRIPIVARVL